MLTQETNMQSRGVFALLVFVYISMATPLIHPFLHESFAHEYNAGCHGIDHLPFVVEVFESHDCPLCDFLAANRLQCSTTAPEPIERIGIVYKVGTEKSPVKYTSYTGQHEPRAPPIACK